MYKQQGGLPTEETRKHGRHDLNEFTVEDECIPSPAHISRNEAIVLPEIQTMTGYIRRHYEADIIAEAKRKLHAGDLCVRYGSKIYRACPWPGPADYGEGEMEPNDSEFQAATSPINAGDYAHFADIRPLNGEITWMNFWRTGGNFVDAELVLTMHIELDIDGVKTDVSEGVVAQVLLVEEAADLEASSICGEFRLVAAARDVRGSGDDLVGVCASQEGAQVGKPVCQGDGLQGVFLLFDSLAGLPPSGVAGQVREQVCPGGFELVADESQPQEPAPEGVLGVVGHRASRAGGLGREGLCADREEQLDVGLDLPGVECAVEGPELDGSGRPLEGEGRVEVQRWEGGKSEGFASLA